MSRFLIATMPVPGHIAPIAPIARKLVERGNEVVWYTSQFFQKKVEATGARFAPLKSTLDYGDSEYNRYFPERAKHKDLAQVKFDFKHLFIEPIPGYMKDLREILKDFKADVLIGDSATAAMKLLADETGLPWVVMNITVLGTPSRDTAPFGLGMLPSSSVMGRLRNRLLYWVAEKVVFRDVQAYYDAMAARNGLPHFIFRPTESEYLYLQPSVPAFEYPRSDLSPQVHFIGPLLPEAAKGFTPPAWWPEVTNAQKPVVLVTQGTIATDAEQLIAPTLQALADEDVLVVATTGGKTAAELGLNVPANAHVEPFIPFGELMPHISAMITNGGYGGVTIALAHGVPVVSGGTTEDKAEVSNRIAYSGVGVNLKTATPSAEQIRAAVRQVLADSRFREKAKQMQAEFARHDGPTEGARLLERLALTQAPVLRTEPAAARLEPSVAASGAD
jgi:MGT family glycosyltransferase